jgi:hypothetical protein
VPPTLDAIGNVTVAENAGLQTVNLTGIGLGSGTSLAITASSGNKALVANPTVNYTSPNATGSLTFTPVANQYGTAVITVTANNGQAQSNVVIQTFLVTIVPPDESPTLDPINDLTLDFSSAGQAVTLTGIDPGTGGSIQKLTITAKSSNSKIVSNPKVSYLRPQTTGTLIVKPVANASGTAVITVTVNNGGKTQNVFLRSFTLTVLPNKAPTLNPIGDLVLAGNSAAQVVNLGGISSGSIGEVQKLKVTAKSSNSKIISNPSVSYHSPGTNGTLTFKPAANASGTAVITVTVNDGGKSNNIVSRTFTVTVLPNQLPTLDPIGDVTVDYNAAAQTINLTGIGPGANGEIQKLSVTASSDNPKLVSNPSVSYHSPGTNGTLTFKPAANASGTAVITVTVNDGAKSNNIVTQSFNVTVLPDLTPKVAQSLAVIAPNPAAVLSSMMTTNGQFSLTVNGVAGYQYTVEASLDLIHWTPIYTNTAPFTFEDDQTSEYSGQFYRAVYQPSP